MDTGNTHFCRCQAGYTGSYCEEQVDECSPNPCQNGATCTDYLGGYSCEVGAWRGRNSPQLLPFCCPRCCHWARCPFTKLEARVLAVLLQPCGNGGNLSDRSSLSSSQCVAGYHGVNCSEEINECLSHPCQNGGTCIDLINTYKCSCPRGTQGKLIPQAGALVG